MNRYDVSMKNYIAADLSICREERQYALYLSNILRYYGAHEHREKIREGDAELYRFLVRLYVLCGICEEETKEIPKELTIENVFYEAAFLRDFLERNRRIKLAGKRKKVGSEIEKICRQKSYLTTKGDQADYSVGDIGRIEADSFNYCLLKYVMSVGDKEAINTIGSDVIAAITERNYGHNEIPDGLLSKAWEKQLLVCMMNAKPDLAVCYARGDKRYLLFLECKFESRESSYGRKDRSGENGSGENGSSQKEGDRLTQTRVQWHVARFLTEYLTDHFRDEPIGIPASMADKEQSVLVTFGRNDDEPEKLEIGKLIRLERKIFSGNV